MSKNIILFVGGAIVITAAAGYLLLSGGGGGGDQEVVSSECASLCEGAANACPSLIDEGKCLTGCEDSSEETKEYLSGAGDCEELMAKPELISDLITAETSEPKVSAGTDKDADASQECEAACGRYVTACLTLVPNATPALFDEGYQSCLGQCAGWDGAKTECMIGAFDCEAMTEQCGL